MMVQAASVLSRNAVAKPWGREELPPPFETSGVKPIGEIWFELKAARDTQLLAAQARSED